jgi:tetratricopeptide (TPR) repeat protein
LSSTETIIRSPALKALSSQSASPGARTAASAGHGIGEHELALKDLTKVIEIDPTSAITYNNRGALRNERQDYAAAIIDCTKAIETEPDLANAYYNRGNALGNREIRPVEQAISRKL